MRETSNATNGARWIAPLAERILARRVRMVGEDLKVTTRLEGTQISAQLRLQRRLMRPLKRSSWTAIEPPDG